MPWSADEYEQAKELVDSIEDPKQKSALQQGIKKFELEQSRSLSQDPEVDPEARGQLKVKAAQQSGLNPQFSPFGLGAAPTGIDALGKNELFTGGQADRMPEQVETGVHLARKAGGGFETTPKVTRGAERPKLTPRITQADQETTLQAPETGLPSATGANVLYRPPELMPKNLSFGKLMGARVEFEPSVDQFRADMGPSLGPAIMALDENSAEYKAYADNLWMQKYDAAEKAGLPLVRKQYMNRDTWQEQVIGGKFGIVAGRDAAEAMLMGLGNALSLGAIPSVAKAVTGGADEANEQATRNPIPRAVGTVAGAFSPLSLGRGLGGLATQGVTKLAPGLAGKYIGAGLGGALAGGAGATFEKTVEVGGSVLPNTVTGLFGEDKKARLAAGDAAYAKVKEYVDELPGTALTGAGLGAAGGVAGQALGGLAQKAVTALREGRYRSLLPAFERAGGQTSFFRGVKPTASMKQNIREATALSGGESLPAEVAAMKVKVPMANQAASNKAANVNRIFQEKQAYFESPEGMTHHPVKNTIAKVGELLNRGEDSLGEDLAFVNQLQMDKQYHKLFTPTLIDESGANTSIALNGGWKMSLDKAKKLGLLDNAVRLESARNGGQRVLLMDPKELNASQLDQIVQSIDEAADVAAGSTASGKAPKAYRELMDAVRDDIRQFKPNRTTGYDPVKLTNGQEVYGWAAMRNRHAQLLGESEDTLQRLKLPQGIKPTGWADMSPKEKMAFEAFLAKAGKNPVGSEVPASHLANQAGVLPQYYDIAGTSAFLKLKGGQTSVGSASDRSLAIRVLSQLIPGYSLRMDQPMRALANTPGAETGAAIGSMAGAGTSKTRKRQLNYPKGAR